MDIVVVGKGLAGCGLMESLLNHPNFQEKCSRLIWIGPEMSLTNRSSWSPCSLNTTSLIALQGIQKNISPLGDLLFDSYQSSVGFLNDHRPDGFEEAIRYHLITGDEEKISLRFGGTETFNILGKEFTGAREKAYLAEPLKFFHWWNKRIDSLAQANNLTLLRVEELAVQIDSNKKTVLCQKSTFSFDKLFFATGALAIDMPLMNGPVNKGKKVVGHYIQKKLDKTDFPFDKSTVLTMNGHNLIFNKAENTLILGGSNEGEGPKAPSFVQLKNQKDSFLKEFPEWAEVLNFNRKHLFTGTRYKGQKRTPFVRKLDENIGEINGLYKNGWTLCHHLPNRLLELF